MKRPAAWRSQRGLLLLDAVLSAIVIAVGLVFITRGLAGQLRVLRKLEESDVLSSLAQSKLVELEAGARLTPRRLPQQITDAAFGPLYGEAAAAYRWSVHATPMDNPESSQLSPSEVTALGQVAVTITRQDSHAILYTLRAVWPKTMVPDEWS